MTLKRIRESFSNNNGAATPMILMIIFLILIGFAMLFHYFYTVTTINTIHQSCRAVAESVLVANAEASYQAKRDGYSGVWHLDNGEITDSTVYVDPAVSLAQQLNLVNEGDSLVKKDGDKQVYRLRDINLVIQNPDFKESQDKLTATLSLIVDIDLKFPLVDNYPVSIPVNVSAVWDCKF